MLRIPPSQPERNPGILYPLLLTCSSKLVMIHAVPKNFRTWTLSHEPILPLTAYKHLNILKGKLLRFAAAIRGIQKGKDLYL